MSATIPKIAVLMAVRNGESWIRAQLQSIALQTAVEPRVIISDDGSSDSTLSVAQAAFASFSLPGSFLDSTRPGGSAGRNFFKLVLDADLGDAEYVAFCDQDDIWYVDKLSRAVSALTVSGASGYSSAVRAVWSDGKTSVLSQSSAITSADYLFEGAGQGCTFVLHRNAFEFARRALLLHESKIGELHYHDWTVYALTRLSGGNWHFDPTPSMDYRQHSANDTGARLSFEGVRRRIRLIKSGWYAGQIRRMSELCLAIGGPGDRYHKECLNLVLAGNRPEVVRRYRQAALVLTAGRRARGDNVVLVAAAVLGWLKIDDHK